MNLITLLAACLGTPETETASPPVSKTPKQKSSPSASLSSSPSSQEQLRGVCSGSQLHDNSLAPGQQILAVKHESANRIFKSPQFSQAFLSAVLDASRREGVEYSVIWDNSKQEMYVVKGESGSLPSFNVSDTLTILHTHPRATADSAPITSHSPPDVIGTVYFSLAQGGAVSTSTVIGSVCGGEMATSSIVAENNVVYVTNSFEKEWIEQSLAIVGLPSALLDALKQLGLNGIVVKVDPQKVARELASHAVSAAAQGQILSTLIGH